MESKDDIDHLIPDLVVAYKNYTKWTKFPTEIKGIIHLIVVFCIINFFFSLAFQWKNKLRFVRIYFNTPTFDKITKDRAAKFVDMMSAIGGTMGLLTGFSIISGVEFAYFVAKIVYNFVMSKRNLSHIK